MMCSCAGLAYRNRYDGSRDYKVIGRPGCKVCRGSGWIRKCPACDGTGILRPQSDPQRCPGCDGYGKCRQEEPDKS
jgi:DnaJ-class molecular chaperone